MVHCCCFANFKSSKSTRYKISAGFDISVIAIDAAQRTRPDEWRQQSQENRQGSAGELPIQVGKQLSADEVELQEKARAVYERRIAAGIAREQARKDLPLSTYTEAYWKIDLHNLLNFLNLRMHDHAQQEIRAYAVVIGEEIVAKWTPIVWEAFVDYRKNATQLSYVETKIVAALISGNKEAAEKIAKHYSLLNRKSDGGLLPNRERRELETKLAVLGLAPFRK
jgi:thymidylate synthase (FAD)